MDQPPTDHVERLLREVSERVTRYEKCAHEMHEISVIGDSHRRYLCARCGFEREGPD